MNGREVPPGQRSAGGGFALGDKVLIDSPGHPWHGHAGRIDSPGDADMGWDWCIALAGYPGCATTAADRNLRPAYREAGQ